LNRVQPNGRSSVLADLLAYETTVNPDQGATYGFVPPLPDSCAAAWPVADFGPPTYNGQIDAHPYSVAIGNGEYFVADAAANAILRVSANGRISTVAVLPGQPIVLTADNVTALGLDPCVVGRTYNFEPVPTDVEIGPDGMLYVTTLPGGPEGPQLGPRGSVYRVNPHSGAATRIATGFLGATNVAISPKGTIYVAELFANRVSKVVNGMPVVVAEVNQPAGLEYANGKLYVAFDVLSGNGKLGTIQTME
jgi:streptogramin lyase